MKKIVIAPDSFKGALPALDVANAIAAGIHRVWPGADCALLPMADGGEGTLDAVLSVGGVRQLKRVSGAAAGATRQTVRRPAREAAYGAASEVASGAASEVASEVASEAGATRGGEVDAAFGIVERDGRRIAIIEIAQVVGITEPSGMAIDVGRRTTRGVGELLRHALDLGLRDFMIGLGGSSTNDGGAGLLAGLGMRLSARDGHPVDAHPEALADLDRVDASTLDPRIAECRITIMSDVNNPLTGPRGATAIFGPQKGVTPGKHERYDEALAHFARLAEAALNRKAADKPGAGAAGGLGFALQLLGAEFHSGAEIVADLLGLDQAIRGAGWVITGEGRSDIQTLLGKTPHVVAQRAAKFGVPVTLLSGGIDRAALPALSKIFAGCFSLVFGPTTLDRAIAESAGLLADSAEQLARLRAATI